MKEDMDHLDTREKLRLAAQGDKSARNRLVEENTGLVHSVVKRFVGRGYDREDLFQIGCIGLIKAIDHFNLEYQVQFSTYAVPLIMGEIRRFLRDDGMVKVSRSTRELGWKLKRQAILWEQRTGQEATLGELAAALEVEPEDAVVALEAVRSVDSLDRPLDAGDGKPGLLLDLLAEQTQQETDPEKEKVLDRMMLNSAMGLLSERDQQLIRCRYFRDMTQTQTARVLGISQVQVCRLEKKILRQLRSYW